METEIKEESLVTFAQIMDYTNLSHNSVSKKMKALGIRWQEKTGRTMLYSREDMERINEYRPLPYKPGTVFYRVSIRVGCYWVVTDAGLPISRAKLAVEKYKKQGIKARYTPCA